ncbi:MAG: tRNA glutamyl-Q(34) synthetase GluQRS [Alicyclobacillus sp.]|nr:tRNA glutamyl-Q(34) synthetase GluQRS [Alicyclobacillus sp.]
MAGGQRLVRGRFAPSPTGWLHLGHAWTALLAWLQVRQAGGAFVLRIEDVDTGRSRLDFLPAILADLRWLGLDWDEGPDCGGPYGPYLQSQRFSYYRQALHRLAQTGRLYPCFCSRAQVQAASAPHGLAGEGPVYPGTCRHLTPQQRALHARAKRPALRFAVPREPVCFADLVCGEQCFLPGAGGDFVVQRADGLYAYQLAVVVDDLHMRISHVLRGSDLLDSTPRQIWLYQALGGQPPQFAHVPLLLAPDGTRLSKRHGSLTLRQFQEAGVAAPRLVGWLAYLAGWLDRPEPVQPRELLVHFSLATLGRSVIRLRQEDLHPFFA